MKQKMLVHLLYFVCSANTYINGGINHCHERIGTSIFTLKVSMDNAIIKDIFIHMTATNLDVADEIIGIEMFFGRIFDEINQKLYRYGVQFEMDLSQPSTNDLYLNYNKNFCYENNPAFDRGLKALNRLEIFTDYEIGNRLIIFYCPNDKEIKKSYIFTSNECGNLTAIKYTTISDLEYDIKNKVVTAIARYKFDYFGRLSNDFNTSLCYMADQCTKFYKTVYGMYVDEVQLVKNIEYLDDLSDFLDSYSSCENSAWKAERLTHELNDATNNNDDEFIRINRKKLLADSKKNDKKMDVKEFDREKSTNLNEKRKQSRKTNKKNNKKTNKKIDKTNTENTEKKKYSKKSNITKKSHNKKDTT